LGVAGSILNGVVKLLDFGLAKAFSETPDAAGNDPANSPTMTLGATTVGAIMGTAAYMAPERHRDDYCSRHRILYIPSASLCIDTFCDLLSFKVLDCVLLDVAI
jgi:serine/threonine protein kinase